MHGRLNRDHLDLTYRLIEMQRYFVTIPTLPRRAQLCLDDDSERIWLGVPMGQTSSVDMPADKHLGKQALLRCPVHIMLAGTI